VLENDPLVSEHLSASRLTQLLDPTTATGSSALFVRQVVARYKEQRLDVLPTFTLTRFRRGFLLHGGEP
jgi:hypothetical protein